MKNKIKIGKVLRPFGINGALKILFDNPQSESLKPGIMVHFVAQKIKKPDLCVKSIINGGRVFFEGFEDRTSAESYAGAQIFISREDLPELEDDEVYYSDLIGFKVSTSNGELLGEIIGFSDNHAQDLAEIKTVSGEKASFPFVKPLVVEVKEEEKNIIVDLPQGLIE